MACLSLMSRGLARAGFSGSGRITLGAHLGRGIGIRSRPAAHYHIKYYTDSTTTSTALP